MLPKLKSGFLFGVPSERAGEATVGLAKSEESAPRGLGASAVRSRLKILGVDGSIGVGLDGVWWAAGDGFEGDGCSIEDICETGFGHGVAAAAGDWLRSTGAFATTRRPLPMVLGELANFCAELSGEFAGEAGLIGEGSALTGPSTGDNDTTVSLIRRGLSLRGLDCFVSILVGDMEF